MRTISLTGHMGVEIVVHIELGLGSDGIEDREYGRFLGMFGHFD